MKAGVNIDVDEAEFAWQFARSGGPGGQNVNKVNSKAILKWAIGESQALNDFQKRRFKASFHTRINLAGIVVIQSDVFRDQARNMEDCRARLSEMIATIEFAPKKRRKTSPTRQSVEKRLQTKKRRKDIKGGRRRPSED